MVLDPGHFHAALIQKGMYEQIDSTVQVYAPKGKDVDQYLQMIGQFNTRADAPTDWVSRVYTGKDYLKKMSGEKAGNVVILAGNNAKKIQYIRSSVNAGQHVLADKPMIIHPEEFKDLQEAFNTARGKEVVLYDIMTERYNIYALLQKDLASIPALFGRLQEGTPENPAITKESVHHFFKKIAGKPVKRPPWYFDVSRQGEGIVDISTHLVDLILWECFPGEGVSVEETEVIRARRWPTAITLSQFKKVTDQKDFPEYLQDARVHDTLINVYSNGSFVFRFRGVYGKVSVSWKFQAPEGGGDTHLSVMRGTNASLVIRQGRQEGYEPALYVEPASEEIYQQICANLENIVAPVSNKYPGVSFKPVKKGLRVVIPDKYKTGHEAHFAMVMEKYLQYVKAGRLPDWERQTMLTKYYITTQAYAHSR